MLNVVNFPPALQVYILALECGAKMLMRKIANDSKFLSFFVVDNSKSHYLWCHLECFNHIK